MRFFFYLILLSFIWVEFSLTTGNNYILCTSNCPSLTLPFHQASTLPNECQDNDQAIFETAAVCVVEYQINYRTQEISLNFKALNETDQFDVTQQNQLFLQTVSSKFAAYEVDGPFLNRTFYCTMKNDCARSFYLSTIENLVNEGHSKLEHIKTKLFNASVFMDYRSRRRCTDSHKTGNKTSVACPLGACHAHYVYDDSTENIEEKHQNCHRETDSHLTSELKYHLSSASSRQRESIDYRCNKNVCNRNDMIHIIKKIIDEYTNWNSSKQEMPEVQTKQLNSLSIRSMMSSSVLVLFLISFQFFI